MLRDRRERRNNREMDLDLDLERGGWVLRIVVGGAVDLMTRSYYYSRAAEDQYGVTVALAVLERMPVVLEEAKKKTKKKTQRRRPKEHDQVANLFGTEEAGMAAVGVCCYFSC